MSATVLLNVLKELRKSSKNEFNKFHNIGA